MHLSSRSRRVPATILAAFAAALAAFTINADPARAAVSSASINGATGRLNLDGANDTETVLVTNGRLVHPATGGGLNSTADWDSATRGARSGRAARPARLA